MAQRSSIRRSAIVGGVLVAILGIGVSAVAYKFRDTTPSAVGVGNKPLVTTSTPDLATDTTDTTTPALGVVTTPPPLAALDTVTGSSIVSTTTVAAVPSTTISVAPVSACAPLDGSGARVAQFSSAPPKCLDPNASYSAVITTKQGEIRMVLNARDTPNAVNNFVFLARNKFYDGLTFHRIVPGFVVQGGDPLGNGEGGPGYEFADELPSVSGYPFGSVAMANSGPNTNGSQFFLVSGDLGLQLPPSFTLFGKVTKGADVLKAINNLGKPPGVDGIEFPPTEVVTIEKVRIVSVNERASRIPALNPDALTSTTSIAP